MKAIVYQQFGTASVLQTVEQAKPSIKKHQVLIRIKAFSINPMDWKIRKGEMKLMSGSKFPKHTGADFAGIVEETGLGVNDFKKGDEVFGVVTNMMKEGVSAEFVVIPASLIWKKPVAISYAQASSIPVVGTAAVTALEKMGNVNSKTILVNGATGGFGMFLLQLLKSNGANVTAVTGSKGTEFAKRWGATEVIDYNETDVLAKETQYDIIIDLSGKMNYSNARKIMKSKALYLNPTPRPIEIPVSLFKNLFRAQKHIVILSSPGFKHTKRLLAAISNGLEIVTNKTFSFDQYQQAYQYAERGGYVGKVVIEL